MFLRREKKNVREQQNMQPQREANKTVIQVTVENVNITVMNSEEKTFGQWLAGCREDVVLNKRVLRQIDREIEGDEEKRVDEILERKDKNQVSVLVMTEENVYRFELTYKEHQDKMTQTEFENILYNEVFLHRPPTRLRIPSGVSLKNFFDSFVAENTRA